MIDIHCHILPGVDDGSFAMEESIRMARMAVESGVTDIIATPHCNFPTDQEPLWAEDFKQVRNRFRQVLKEENIPLRIHSGMEIFGLPNTPELLEEGRLIPLAGTNYPLVEFPFTNYGEEATALLEALTDGGWRPVVAHPERYHYTQYHPELLNLWVDMGCLLQINRGSLLGRFGPREEALADGLLERGFVTCIASDAHRSTVRTPWLADVWDLVSDREGEAAARILLEDNPRAILEGREIKSEEPDWF